MSETPRLPTVAQRHGLEADDPSIPLLTDRIFLPALDLDIPTTTAPATTPPVAPPPPAAEAQRPASRSFDAATVVGTLDLPVLLRIAGLPDEASATAGGGSATSIETSDGQDAGPPGEPGAFDPNLDAEIEAMLDAAEDLDAAAAEPPADAADATVAAEHIDAAPVAAATDVASAETETTGPQPSGEAEQAAVEPPIEAAAEAAVPPAQEVSPVAEAADAAPGEVRDDTSDGETAFAADAVATPDDGPPAITASEQQSAAEPPGDQAPPPALDEDALRAAVVDAVVQRLPVHLDAAMREMMQPAIDQAVAKIGEEARFALGIVLRDLAEQALREELERRRQQQ